MGAGMPTTIKKVLLLQSPSQLSMSPIILLFRYIWVDCSTDIRESQAFPNFFERKAVEEGSSTAWFLFYNDRAIFFDGDGHTVLHIF